jgi:hypothetical protein
VVRAIFFAIAVIAGLVPAQPGRPSPARGPHQVMCGHLQHIAVSDGAGRGYIVKNDNYGRMPECLGNSGLAPNFQVLSSAAASTSNAVMAYPEIYTGCSWGICSPGSVLPLPLSQVGQPEVSWRTGQNAPGRWDAALDIWFDPEPIMTGQATGAEMMIWLNARNYPRPPRGRIARVDGQRWYLWRSVARHDGASWHYLQFRLVRPATQIRRLAIGPFIRLGEALRWIRPQWWLLNIEAGFEIWRGGTGLATWSFSAVP